MTPFAVELRFHGDLPFFLKSKMSKIERRLSERTSVKDVIEACGVPHTEVDLILIGGERADFGADDLELASNGGRACGNLGMGKNSGQLGVFRHGGDDGLFGSFSLTIPIRPSESTLPTILRPRIGNWSKPPLLRTARFSHGIVAF